MARSIIGSLWNPAQRNELNRMLLELYEGIDTATGTKNKIDAFLEGTGVVSRKMLANSSVDTTKIADDSITNSKIKNGEVINSKIGNGAVSADKTNFDSLSLNKGKHFPFESLNGNRNVIYSNAFLDIQVHNAEVDALYKVQHVSKNNTSWGDPVTFMEFRKSKDNGNTWTQIIVRNQANLANNQSGIKTHVITKEGIEEYFDVTVDWESFNVGSNNVSLDGADYIIHPSNYLYAKKEVKALERPYLENKGKVYPFISLNGERYSYYDNAILDLKISTLDLSAKYRIDHISKNSTAWGDPITFIRFQKSIDNGNTWSQIVGRNHANLDNNQTGIQTHFITHDGIDEIFNITMDWDALNHSTQSAYNLPSGTDYIIDPSLHSFKRSSKSTVNDLGDDIVVKIDGRTIAVKQKLNDEKNLIVVYDKLKVNEFHEVNRFIEQLNTASDSDFNGTVQLTNNTDWVSPYGLMAVNNPVSGSAGSITVGGAHGVDGGSGFPTGRFSEYVTIKLDGVAIGDGVHRGKSLELVVDHYVSASNAIVRATGAKRDSIRERRTYTITSGAHEVQVDLTALEDVHLTRYAGLQITQPDYYTEFYRYDNRPEGLLPIKGLSEGFHIADEKDYAKLDRVALINDSHMLIMLTDRNFGIGDGSLAPAHTVENPQSPIYITGGQFGKIYAHNLGRNSNEYLLEAGNTISYRGGYYFVRNTSAEEGVFEYAINGTTYTNDLR